MTPLDIAWTTLFAFAGGLLMGFLLLLLRGSQVTSRPLRALRRRLLGRAWQPVLMEPAPLSPADLRHLKGKPPSSATR